MKIAFIVSSLASSGPIIATQRLINSIKHLADIEIFYFDNVLEVEIDVVKHQISFLGKTNFDNFDIVHSTGIRPDTYSLRNSKRTQRVSSVHCYITEDLEMLHGKIKSAVAVWFWKAALKRMQAIVVSSNFMASYYHKLLSVNNTVVIPYAVELPFDAQISSEEQVLFYSLKQKGYKIIGNVSLLIKRKGLEQLIDLLKIKPDHAVVIIGDGELKEELIGRAKNMNVEDRFFILGFKDQSFKYYKYMDIYAMPSRSEGFSLATLEAFASKLPVVSTRLPYYEEFFNDREICFFKLDDLESLSLAVTKASVDRDEIVKNASAVFDRLFTIDSLSKSHIVVYEEVLLKKQ